MSESLDLLSRAVPQEKARLEHLKLDDAPSEHVVMKKVDSRVAPAAWGHIDSLDGNLDDFCWWIPRFICSAPLILRTEISWFWNLADPMGHGTAPE